jgi:hypothetical protein
MVGLKTHHEVIGVIHSLCMVGFGHSKDSMQEACHE